MPVAKIAITLDEDTLKELDQMVKTGTFASRSAAIQEALIQRLEWLKSNRFEEECKKLKPDEEQSHAKEVFGAESKWPDY